MYLHASRDIKDTRDCFIYLYSMKTNESSNGEISSGYAIALSSTWYRTYKSSRRVNLGYWIIQLEMIWRYLLESSKRLRPSRAKDFIHWMDGLCPSLLYYTLSGLCIYSSIDMFSQNVRIIFTNFFHYSKPKYILPALKESLMKCQVTQLFKPYMSHE